MPIDYPVVEEDILAATATVEVGGSNSATRQFVVSFGSKRVPMAPDFLYGRGLPKIGTLHPQIPNIKLRSYDISVGSSGQLIYTANYASSESGDTGEPSEEEGERQDRLISRGWAGGSVDRDLVYDQVTMKPVLLPTGEPFDSVPSAPVSVKTLTVRKRVFFAQTAMLMLAANCTVNASDITLAGVTIPRHCGKLMVSAEELLGNAEFTHEVTLSVEVVSQKVRISPGDATETDIGHDVALLLAGYRKLQSDRYGFMHPVQVTSIDSDTGEEVETASPVLLKDDGTEYAPPAGEVPPQPYYLRVSAIREAEWNASWFD